MTDMNSPPWTERFSRGPETYSNLLKRDLKRVFPMEYQGEKQKARCVRGLQSCSVFLLLPFIGAARALSRLLGVPRQVRGPARPGDRYLSPPWRM